MTSCTTVAPKPAMGLARILLVDDDPESRLTLQTILQAGGYTVDAAASAAEAVAKLDLSRYELVLTDLRMESPEAGYRVLAHARILDYKPATAVITTYRDRVRESKAVDSNEAVLIAPEDLPELLSTVADLIAVRATRQVAKAMRQAS